VAKCLALYPVGWVTSVWARSQRSAAESSLKVQSLNPVQNKSFTRRQWGAQPSHKWAVRGPQRDTSNAQIPPHPVCSGLILVRVSWTTPARPWALRRYGAVQSRWKSPRPRDATMHALQGLLGDVL